jgi:hypothetical protein
MRRPKPHMHPLGRIASAADVVIALLGAFENCKQ